MKKLTREFVDDNWDKIRLLKESERSQVYLVMRQEQLAVLKMLRSTGLCYKKLRQLQHKQFLWPEILYLAEDKDDGETWLVEEYVDGESLQSRIDRKVWLTKKELQLLLTSLAQGLAVIHAAGLVHRDIKPEHIIMQKGGRVRLLDFEAAREVRDNSGEGNRDTRLLGTAGYAPPEQYGFAQTDARSDIYAIGVTLQQCLGENHYGRLEKILARCRELDPARRWQSCEEIIQALARYERMSRLEKYILPAGICLLAAAVALAPKLWQQIEMQNTEQKTMQTEAEKPEVKQEGTEAGKAASKKTAAYQSAPKTAADMAESEQLPYAVNNQGSGAVPEYSQVRVSLSSTVGKIVSAEAWSNWQQPYQSASPIDAAPRIFPVGCQLVLHVENQSQTVLENPRAVFSLPDGEEQVSAAPLAPGETSDFTVDLTGRVMDSELWQPEVRFYTASRPDDFWYDFTTIKLDNPVRHPGR